MKILFVLFLLLLSATNNMIDDKYLKYAKCFYKDGEATKILFAKLHLDSDAKKVFLYAFIAASSKNNEMDLGFKMSIEREANLLDSDVQNLKNSNGKFSITFEKANRLINDLECTYTLDKDNGFVCSYENICSNLDDTTFINYRNQADRFNTLLISAIVLGVFIVIMLIISLVKIFCCCCF